jgi:hypothetical protein
MEGPTAPEIAARMSLCGKIVRFWLQRFNERGFDGLEEVREWTAVDTYSAE